MSTSTTRSLPPPVLYDLTKHEHIHPQIVQIHRDCVTHDGMLATILDVEHPTKLQDYWARRRDEVIAGTRIIVLQFAAEDEAELVGLVMLDMPVSETGPFRSSAEKLMVSPNHRRKGIARVLMMRLEEVARREHRELVMLDTTIGTDAEHVYPRLGYTPFGIVPRYGISPRDGSLMDELFFYKDLRDQKHQVNEAQR